MFKKHRMLSDYIRQEAAKGKDSKTLRKPGKYDGTHGASFWFFEKPALFEFDLAEILDF